MLSKIVILAVATASAAVAQNSLYSQCGGQDWSGSTSCVSGATCQYQNAYYSQCLPSDNGSSSGERDSLSQSDPSAKNDLGSSESTSTSAASTPSSAPSSTVVSSGAASTGKTYKASFTEYGTGDQNGSPNCNTATTACGFYTSPGYSAAVSQNEFGVGPVSLNPSCAPFRWLAY
ncbi:carbohydrate-binding module family 1 protein [Acidomyces richmondensis BFW]|nr:MAG: carbohydrate-binding module family 1 protein [Acidomyces sp. 'richmondensis']KYG50551.1 carbohydrate-binding module family 1 protein [Acidomyces richmondensis BFW]